MLRHSPLYKRLQQAESPAQLLPSPFDETNTLRTWATRNRLKFPFLFVLFWKKKGKTLTIFGIKMHRPE